MAGLFSTQLEPYLPSNPEEKTAARHRLGRLKTITEFLEGVVAAVEDTDLPGAVAKASPWFGAMGEATAEALPPIQFVVKLFEGLTRIDDGPTLGYLACCLAYQRAFADALQRVPQLVDFEARSPKTLDVAPAEGYDFQTFSFEKALEHPFIHDADDALRHFLRYGLDIDDDTVVRRTVGLVHNRFGLELRLLLTDRSTRDRFQPFFQLIQLDSGDTDAYGALEQHARHQRWLYEDRPVLDSEPFALRHIYVDLDCGDLPWGEIEDSGRDGEMPRGTVGGPHARQGKALDPFLEQHGGRQPLLGRVLHWLEDPDYDEAIVIQGSAGSGKTSFTVRLCTELEARALRPIRIELKNLATHSGKDLREALPEAVELDDLRRTSNTRLRFGPGLFRNNRIFDDPVVLENGAKISRYVLILDGWDEISTAASLGYRNQLEKVLRMVRDEFLRNRNVKVRVILAGRPTRALADSDFFRSKTRVLTVRPMQPNQLGDLIAKFRQAAASRPIAVEGAEAWSLDHAGEALDTLVQRYVDEWQEVEEAAANQRTQPPLELEALGQPLLTHLILRLIAEEPTAAEPLVDNPTTLYRSMVDLVISNAGKPEGEAHQREGQAVVTGDDLRLLLQNTAAAMKALDVRDLPQAELKIRLRMTVDTLRQQVRRLGVDRVLSRLMISFFFKGGHPEHGCAFSHKSFREYLFAERVMERLKAYGREAPDTLPPRAPHKGDYWRDFPNRDPRWALSRDLTELLGPQWLNPEELSHLGSLLEWELARTFGDDAFPAVGMATQALEAREWRRIRNGLADLWGWWGNSAHLRSQPHVDVDSGRIEYTEPLGVKVARLTRWRSQTETEQIPTRTVTIDARLGDSLYALTVWVHHKCVQRTLEAALGGPREQTREYQTLARGETEPRFAPSGSIRDQFQSYIARVNAGGYRSLGPFPRHLPSQSIDLSGADFVAANLAGANLYRANLQDADLYGANLQDANLEDANLYRANLSHATLEGATLEEANLQGANLYRANLSHTNLYGADLYGANLEDANLSRTNLEGANLEDANLYRANLQDATLEDANLQDADLYGANLEDANLQGANLQDAIPYGAKISKAQLRTTRGTPAVLPNGPRIKTDAEYKAWLGDPE